VQSTRARIVELLRADGGATVDDITHALDLAPATVRRHLDVLLRDGLVEMRSERVPLGRPHFVFRLTETGQDALPRHQMHLVVALLQSILALTPEDTRGRSGRDVAPLVFDRLVEHLVAGCRPVVTAPDLDRRVEQALEVLADAGLEFDLATCDDGFVVHGGSCLCARLLPGLGECGHELDLLAGLLGASVERMDGPESSNSPAYLVRTGAQGVL
jgi:predicted ArsR family transcriptional regulator